MANRYWVAATGGNFLSTSSWSTSSGGASGASVPGVADTAIFDAASFSQDATVTFSFYASIGTLDCSALDQNVIFDVSGYFLELRGGASLNNKVTITTASTGILYLDYTGNFNQNSATLNVNLIKQGTSTVTLTGDLSLGSGKSLTLVAGNLNSGGYSISTDSLNFTGSSSRQLILNASSINVDTITCTNNTNLTFNAGTSSINPRNTSLTITTTNLSLDFYNLNVSQNTTISTGAGAPTFNTITITNGKSLSVNSGATIVVTNLVMSGTSVSKPTLTASSGTFTLSKSSGTANALFAIISGCIATGGATFNANKSTLTNCTGWNEYNRLYYIGGTGNLSASTNWTLVDGTTQYGVAPSSSEDLILNANSFSSTGLTATVDAAISCRSLNFTGVLNVPTIAGSASIYCSSSLTLVSGINLTYTGTLSFSTSATFDTAGKTLLCSADLTGVTISNGLVLGSTSASVQNFNSSSLQTTVDGVTIPGNNTIGTFNCTKNTKFTGSNTFTTLTLST